MERYESYEIDDFLNDDLFIDWILIPTETADKYWQDVFTRFPAIRIKADEARKLLSNIHIKPGPTMPMQLRMEILNQILSTQNKKAGEQKKWRISVRQTIIGSAA